LKAGKFDSLGDFEGGFLNLATVVVLKVIFYFLRTKNIQI